MSQRFNVLLFFKIAEVHGQHLHSNFYEKVMHLYLKGSIMQ